MKYQKICEYCGLKFETDKMAAKYCCKECAAEARRQYVNIYNKLHREGKIGGLDEMMGKGQQKNLQMLEAIRKMPEITISKKELQNAECFIMDKPEGTITGRMEIISLFNQQEMKFVYNSDTTGEIYKDINGTLYRIHYLWGICPDMKMVPLRDTEQDNATREIIRRYNEGYL